MCGNPISHSCGDLFPCGSLISHFMWRLVPRVRGGRGVIQDAISPVPRFRPQGFSRRQLNVGKDDRRLDARGKCRFLDDA